MTAAHPPRPTKPARRSGYRSGVRGAFTLIELLVVVAIVAVLAVVVILTINPQELLKQSRDSIRISDLGTLNAALALFLADVGGSIGSASTVYVSIPDTSPTCANLGLPALPTGWNYACVTQQNLRNVDGTGWIPVNFASISFKTPFGVLPVDPSNTTSTGNYYTYTVGGTNNSQYELTMIPESAKQRTNFENNTVIQNYPGVYAEGSNVGISPLFNSSGLVEYLPFNEGSGTSTTDVSGNGNNGTITSPVWVSGKIGSALDFNAGVGYVTVANNNSINLSNTLTVSAWVRYMSTPAVNTATQSFSKWTGTADANYVWYWYNHASWCPDCNGILANEGGVWQGLTSYATMPSDSAWHFFAETYNNASSALLYVDGSLTQSSVASGTLATNSQNLVIGNIGAGFHEQMDDVRIYNRALSAAEIQAIYNATK